MDRPSEILVVGADGGAERAYVEPLRTAGHRVRVVATVDDAAGVDVVFVAGGDLEQGCRAARASAPQAYVVACTPRDSKGPLVQFCFDAGADDALSTPPQPSIVLSRVRAALDHRRSHQIGLGPGSTLTILDEIADALAADPIEGLHEAASRLGEALGFSRCAVLALSDDEPLTLFVVAASDDPTVIKLPIDVRKYPELRAAFETREPVFVSDAATSDLLGEFAALAAEHGGHTLLALPVLADRRPVGALLLRSQTEHAPLDDAQMALARLASRVFAASMRGGRLSEVLREQTRRVSLASYEEARKMRAVERYREFFESAADGIFVVDGTGVVLYLNNSAAQLTGYALSGLQGKKIHDIVAAAQRDGLTDVITHASAGVHLAGFDLQLLTTSGEKLRLSVSTSASLDETGLVVLSFRDVTIKRALEEELRKTKDFLERLIDSTIDAIVAADLHGNLIIFNEGAERLYGYSAAEVIGKIPVWQLYPEGVAKKIMAELRATGFGGPGRLEPTRREIRSKSGELIPVSLTASMIYEHGREVASVGILSDLRDRLKIEQRLAQAQEKLIVSEKQALIAELAGTTAHELNQPLTSVMGYAELIKKRLNPDDGQSRAVDIIIREAERMAEIVRKIGKITKYETKPYVGGTTILDLDKSTTEG